MGVFDNNIFTITEPNISLDTVDIPDIESGNTSDSTEYEKTNYPNVSKIAGGAFPMIKINEYDFNRNDIRYFNLKTGGFLPELSVTVEDSRGIFNLSQFPLDGDVLSIYIRSTDEEIYKPIRIDFDILNVDAPPVNNDEQGAPRDAESDPVTNTVIFNFECRAKIPGLFSEECKGYSNDTSFNHLETLSSELDLGFASNISNTEDVMSRINAFDARIKFIKETTQSAYKNDDSFFTSYIDLYYYLNFVDINKQFKYSEELEDTLVSFMDDLNSKSDYINSDTIDEGKLFITNLPKGSLGTNRFINSYSLQNNAGTSTILNGYRRTCQYYDENAKEYREFIIDPSVSENLPEDLFPLRGRNDENRYQEHIKYKYLGRQSSFSDEGNVHDNFLYSHLSNHQNKNELNKLYLLADIKKANMALYLYQRLPVVIYELSQKRTKTLQQRQEKNEEETGQTISKTGDSTKEMYGAPKINKFLTGIYIIGGIEYIYSRSMPAIKQRLTLLRREWPRAI